MAANSIALAAAAAQERMAAMTFREISFCLGLSVREVAACTAGALEKVRAGLAAHGIVAGDLLIPNGELRQ